MTFACLACRSALAKRDDALACEACGRRWPVVGGLPILVADPAAYLHATSERAEDKKRVAFAPYAFAGATAVERIDVDPTQLASITAAAQATQENFRAVDAWLAPLREALPRFERRSDVLAEADLDRLCGYGPFGTFDHLLRDWRSDSDDAEKIARATAIDGRAGVALVLGSGGGRLLTEIAPQCNEVIAVELSYLLATASRAIVEEGAVIDLFEVRMRSVKAIADRVTRQALKGRARRENVRHVVADAHAVPLKDGAADWVIAAFLFDVVPDGRRLIDEMRRLVRAGGRIVVTTLFGYENDDLWTYYAPEQLIAMIEAHGFTLEEATWSEHPLLASPGATRRYVGQMLKVVARRSM
ncbi:MAG: class I SAM-dependent methyltransferase [Deltaproteobacteria bacterium]|nr:class I SAM-dependent methyltransferase [Deltaproteobacteria bacterium]